MIDNTLCENTIVHVNACQMNDSISIQLSVGYEDFFMLNGVSDSANKSKVSFNGDSRRPESCGQFTYISFYARVFIYGRMLYFFLMVTIFMQREITRFVL
jgi:hypothetical protein